MVAEEVDKGEEQNDFLTNNTKSSGKNSSTTTLETEKSKRFLPRDEVKITDNYFVPV